MLEHIVGYAYFISVLLALCWYPWVFQMAAAAADDSGNLRKPIFRDGASFYDVLGVSKRSSQQEIKRVFRKLAVMMHPDKLGPFGSAEAAAKANDIFVKVQQQQWGVPDGVC